MLDKYRSLEALTEDLGESVYRIHSHNRKSHITIIAPHGGFIEPGTSALARTIADRRYNLFDFQGLLRENPHDLHITATRFRHPQLSALLCNSVAALSVHGMGARGHTDIWLGGLNYELKDLVFDELRAHDFGVNPDGPLWRGEHPKNVVNLARLKGVQLELPNELRAELFVKSQFLPSGRRPRVTERYHALVNAVQSAIGKYAA